jgi:hypothetical protein
MPAQDRFRELCTSRFGTSFHGTRLSKLARLPFGSLVQEYADRFNAVLCHARDLSASQKAELFICGLPDHICVDVELRNPQDL